MEQNSRFLLDQVLVKFRNIIKSSKLGRKIKIKKVSLLIFKFFFENLTQKQDISLQQKVGYENFPINKLGGTYHQEN